MAHTMPSHKVLDIENCCWLPDTVVQHCQDRVAYAPCLRSSCSIQLLDNFATLVLSGINSAASSRPAFRFLHFMGNS